MSVKRKSARSSLYKTVSAFSLIPLEICAFRTYGNPVTPVPSENTGGTASPAVIDDNDDLWIWSGMRSISNPAFHGGSAHAGGPQTYGAYVFHGTGVRIIGYVGPSLAVGARRQDVGKARITIDGDDIATTNTFKDTPDCQATLSNVEHLKPGNHVLKILAVDGWIAVDYLAVETGEVASSATVAGATPQLPGLDYKLSVKQAPDKVLEQWPGVNSDCTVVDLASDIASHSNVWRFTPTSNGRFRISPVDRQTYALSVLPFKTGDHPEVGVRIYTGATGQTWALEPADPGYYRIMADGDRSQCLNDANYGKVDGSLLIIYGWQDSQPNDQWMVQPLVR